MLETAIDVTQFCEHGPCERYALDAPWVVGGVMYATDARICVAVEVADPDSPPDSKGRRRPNAKNVLDEGFSVKGLTWLPWPAAAPTEAIGQCQECKGERYLDQVKCDDCHGAGEVVCDLGHDHVCRSCDGKGTRGGRKCPTCKGNGELMHPQYQSVGTVTIDVKYDAKIRALPGPVMFATTKDEMVAFTFDGGRGMVCGIVGM